MATRYDLDENARSPQADAAGPSPQFMAGVRIMMPGDEGNAVVDTEWNIDPYPPVIDTARPTVPPAAPTVPTPIWDPPRQIETAPLVPLEMTGPATGVPQNSLSGTASALIPTTSGTRSAVQGTVGTLSDAQIRQAARRNRVQAIRDVWWTQGARLDPGDPRLVADLVQFQQTVGLPATGFADADTMKQLRAHYTAGTRWGRQFGANIVFTNRRRHDFFRDLGLYGQSPQAVAAVRAALGDVTVPSDRARGLQVGRNSNGWQYPAALPRWLFPNVVVYFGGVSYDPKTGKREPGRPLMVPSVANPYQKTNKLTDVLAYYDAQRAAGTLDAGYRNALHAGLRLQGEGADEAAEMLRMLPTTSNESTRIPASTTREQIDAAALEREMEARSQAAFSRTRERASAAEAAPQTSSGPSWMSRAVRGGAQPQTPSPAVSYIPETTTGGGAKAAARSGVSALYGRLSQRFAAAREEATSIAADPSRPAADQQAAAQSAAQIAAMEAQIAELEAQVLAGQKSPEQAADEAGAAMRALPDEVAADVIEDAAITADEAVSAGDAAPDDIAQLKNAVADLADRMGQQATMAVQRGPSWMGPALLIGATLAGVAIFRRKS